MNKLTMTVKELQEYLGVGRVKAYELVNSSGFPTVRIGRKILVSRDGLEKWIEKGGTVQDETD